MKKIVPSYHPKYNPIKDLKKVSPFGGLDLKSAFANNAIPSNISADTVGFNEIDNPDSISTRVRDTIDAEILDRGIKSYVPPSGDSKSE